MKDYFDFKEDDFVQLQDVLGALPLCPASTIILHPDIYRVLIRVMRCGVFARNRRNRRREKNRTIDLRGAR